MNFRIVQVSDQQVDAAYGVLEATAAWLTQLGRRQRIANTSREKYRRWQDEQVNYAVVLDDQIAGVFSLPNEEFVDWPEYGELGPAPWLRALATHPDFRGRQIGATAVTSALGLVDQGQPLYLDCVSGFLPGYYQALGFRHLGRQTRDDPQLGPLEITLMGHANGGSIDPVQRCPGVYNRHQPKA